LPRRTRPGAATSGTTPGSSSASGGRGRTGTRSPNWDSVAWCRTVTAEEPNLRVAIATALDLGDVDAALRVACGYWTHCMWGGRAEPLEWLGDALAVEPGADADLAARSEGLL